MESARTEGGRGRARGFLRDTRGSIPVLTALIAIPLVIFAGGALDLVRHEATRVELQDALDHGVLAAASLTQTKPARETIEGYLKQIETRYDVHLEVEEDVHTNSRVISATATTEFDTAFLHLAGVPTMTVPARATAEERRPNIEISILLDISGSMRDNGGIDELKPAAKKFIDTILRPEVRDVTSVNLIPYAGQVNVGAMVFDFLAGGASKRSHNWSSCFEMLDSDFGSGGIPDFPNRAQVPHFTYYNYNVSNKEPWWCPTEAASMMVMSNNVTALKNKIDSLQVYDGTGTAYAAKWGDMLLNPVIRPYMAMAASSGVIPSGFGNRPADYNDPNTLKFVVLMTDGQISFQPRPKNTNYYYQTRSNSDFTNLFSGGQTQNQLDDECDAAKANGITVFTIGFKLDESVAGKLARCASSASHAYRADGLDITEAFSSIATTIQKIRLTE